METIHFPDDPRPPWLVHPVLALGNFDGLHRGHLKIIERVKRGAAEHGGTPMAMTFDPHPPRVVRPDKAPPLLMTKTQRLEALHRAGIACVAVVRFTHELRSEEHTSELQSQSNLVCRLLPEKKKTKRSPRAGNGRRAPPLPPPPDR